MWSRRKACCPCSHPQRCDMQQCSGRRVVLACVGAVETYSHAVNRVTDVEPVVTCGAMAAGSSHPSFLAAARPSQADAALHQRTEAPTHHAPQGQAAAGGGAGGQVREGALRPALCSARLGLVGLDCAAWLVASLMGCHAMAMTCIPQLMLKCRASAPCSLLLTRMIPHPSDGKPWLPSAAALQAAAARLRRHNHWLLPGPWHQRRR